MDSSTKDVTEEQKTEVGAFEILHRLQDTIVDHRENNESQQPQQSQPSDHSDGKVKCEVETVKVAVESEAPITIDPRDSSKSEQSVTAPIVDEKSGHDYEPSGGQDLEQGTSDPSEGTEVEALEVSHRLQASIVDGLEDQEHEVREEQREEKVTEEKEGKVGSGSKEEKIDQPESESAEEKPESPDERITILTKREDHNLDSSTKDVKEEPKTEVGTFEILHRLEDSIVDHRKHDESQQSQPSGHSGGKVKCEPSIGQDLKEGTNDPSQENVEALEVSYRLEASIVGGLKDQEHEVREERRKEKVTEEGKEEKVSSGDKKEEVEEETQTTVDHGDSSKSEQSGTRPEPIVNENSGQDHEPSAGHDHEPSGGHDHEPSGGQELKEGTSDPSQENVEALEVSYRLEASIVDGLKDQEHEVREEQRGEKVTEEEKEGKVDSSHEEEEVDEPESESAAEKEPESPDEESTISTKGEDHTLDSSAKDVIEEQKTEVETFEILYRLEASIVDHRNHDESQPSQQSQLSDHGGGKVKCEVETVKVTENSKTSKTVHDSRGLRRRSSVTCIESTVHRIESSKDLQSYRKTSKTCDSKDRRRRSSSSVTQVETTTIQRTMSSRDVRHETVTLRSKNNYKKHEPRRSRSHFDTDPMSSSMINIPVGHEPGNRTFPEPKNRTFPEPGNRTFPEPGNRTDYGDDDLDLDEDYPDNTGPTDVVRNH